MITIDTSGTKKYSPLIPAIYALSQQKDGEKIRIIMDQEDAFKDLKEFLSEQNAGFREVYDEDKFILEFTITRRNG